MLHDKIVLNVTWFGNAYGGEDNAMYRVLRGLVSRGLYGRAAYMVGGWLRDRFTNRMLPDGAYEAVEALQRLCALRSRAAAPTWKRNARKWRRSERDRKRTVATLLALVEREGHYRARVNWATVPVDRFAHVESGCPR